MNDLKDYFYACHSFDWHFQQDDTYPSQYKKNSDYYQELIKDSRKSELHRKIFNKFTTYMYGEGEKPNYTYLSALLSERNDV